MPPEYRRPDAVEAYRAYYVGAKMPIATYTKRPAPVWLVTAAAAAAQETAEGEREAPPTPKAEPEAEPAPLSLLDVPKNEKAKASARKSSMGASSGKAEAG